MWTTLIGKCEHLKGIQRNDQSVYGNLRMGRWLLYIVKLLQWLLIVFWPSSGYYMSTTTAFALKLGWWVDVITFEYKVVNLSHKPLFLKWLSYNNRFWGSFPSSGYMKNGTLQHKIQMGEMGGCKEWCAKGPRSKVHVWQGPHVKTEMSPLISGLFPMGSCRVLLDYHPFSFQVLK